MKFLAELWQEYRDLAKLIVAHFVILIVLLGILGLGGLYIERVPFDPELRPWIIWAHAISYMIVWVGLLGSFTVSGILFIFRDVLRRYREIRAGIEKRVEDVDARQDYLAEINVGNAFLMHGDFHLALAHFEGLEKDNPKRPQAYVGQAAALKRIALSEHAGDAVKKLELLKTAIDKVSQAIERSPTYGAAFYNRACYKCLRELPTDQVLIDLKRSIELNERFKKTAFKRP